MCALTMTDVAEQYLLTSNVAAIATIVRS